MNLQKLYQLLRRPEENMSNPGLKRYDLKIFNSLSSGKIVKAEVKENPSGVYVKFSDVERLIEALKFYADRCQQVPGTAPQYIEVNNNEVQECFGETARQALSKIVITQ